MSDKAASRSNAGSLKSKTESNKGKRRGGDKGAGANGGEKDELLSLVSKEEKDVNFDSILRSLDKTELFPPVRLQSTASEVVEDKNNLTSNADESARDETSEKATSTKKH